MRATVFYSEGSKIAANVRIPSADKFAGPRPAIIFCAGMSLVKEVWLPEYAERLADEGYVTINFDYRGFGESEGLPRRRLIPQSQVTDVRNAISFLQTLPNVDPNRIALFGASLGASVATYAAGIDARVKALVAIAGPGDLHRVWSDSPKFPAFYEKVMAARRAFVVTGEVGYVSVAKLLSNDPETCALLVQEQPKFPSWSLDISFEGLLDLFEFRPESVVSGSRASLFIYPAADELISKFEMQSMYSHAREPRKIVGLEGIRHAEIYGVGRGFEPILNHTKNFLVEHL